MANIILKPFMGKRPKVFAEYLDPQFAQTAENVDLDDLSIQALKNVSDVKTLAAADLNTAYRLRYSGSEFWITLTTTSNIALAPVSSSSARFYWTDGTKPKQSNYTLASNSGASTEGTPNASYNLGLPKPANALTTVKTGSGTNLSDTVSYVYTFVTDWGEESVPSDPTSYEDINDSEYITLSNFESPPADYNIVGYRVYRANSNDVGEADYQIISDLHSAGLDYIATADVASGIDDEDGSGEIIPGSNLGEAITTSNYDEPNASMKGLIPITNGCFAGYYDKTVYLSEPFLAYAWPQANEYKVDFDIKGLGYFDNTIVICTEAYPYVLTGFDPQAMALDRLNKNYACINTLGIASGPGYVVYPSHDGLVIINANGLDILTKTIFTRNQWKALLTTTTDYDKSIVAFIHDNKYIAFFKDGYTGFIIDLESSEPTYKTFTLSSAYSVKNGYADPVKDALYLLLSSSGVWYIKQWVGNSTNLTYTWKSKVFKFPQYEAFSCAKVIGTFSANDVDLKVYADGSLIHTESNITSEIPFRLPATKSRKWEFEIIGTDRVSEVRIASSMDELNS